LRRTIGTVYHLVDARNWASVQEHGLLSASRLMALSGDGESAALRRHRPSAQWLKSGILIRDQRPMPPKQLASCLEDGLQPEDWFELLNSKVFFWVDPARLDRQRLACGASPQIALVIDATRLLARYGGQANVSPINTGNTMRAAAPRNLSTFVPYERWVVDGWAHEAIEGARKRSVSHRPVELTIADAVPDVFDYVVDSVHLGPQETLTKIASIRARA
jgi:hypothetical protein